MLSHAWYSSHVYLEGIISSKAELALETRGTSYEGCLDRITSSVNGREVELDPKRTVVNSRGESWLCVENPPIVNGVNRILLLLEGETAPDPWPSVQQCEIHVLCD